MNASDVEAEYVPHPLISPILLRYLALIASSQPPPYSSIFLRLACYLSGNFNVNEISHRERVGVKDLKLLLGRYRDFLIYSYR